MSVAYLGIDIDSSDSVVAKKRLQEFREEAKKTGETVDQVAGRHDRAAAAVTRYSESLTKATQSAIRSATAINARLNVRDDFGSAQRAADVQAYGKELDGLRAKYNPLFVANRQYYDSISEISAAHKAGAINEKERMSAMDRAKSSYLQQSNAIRNLGSSAGLTSFQLANMSYQINDIASGIAMGQSPFMILAQQGGQVYQILSSSPQGVGGALKEIGSMIAKIATPARIAVGGVLAIGAAAVSAQNSFATAQIEIETALRGVGSAAGVTVRDINRVADATASITKMSVSEARMAATIIASSGKIAAGDLADAVKLAENLAKILGTDVAEAAQVVAKAFKDPVKGAQELNDRLGTFSAATMRIITNLRDQGRIQEANLVLVREAAKGTKGAADNTTFWAKAWNSVSNAASNAWNEIGKGLDRATSGGTLQDQMDALLLQKKQLEDSFSNRKNRGGMAVLPDAESVRKLAEINVKIEAMAGKLGEAAEQAARVKLNLESIQVGKAFDMLVPEVVSKQALGNIQALINKAKNNPPMLEALGLTEENVALARARAEAAANTFKSAQEMAVAQTQLSIRAIAARSPAERASIAYQQTMLMLSGQNISQLEKEARASGAARLAFRDASQTLSDAARDRKLAIEDALGQTDAEYQSVGKNIAQAELLRMNWQTYAELRREAARNNTQFDEAEYARLQALNAELARRKELVAAAQLRNDLSFERDQLGRSDMDATVAQRLRSAGLPVDLQSAEAQMIRLNEQLKLGKDLASDFASGFARDMRNGATAAQAFSNQLAKIADKLLDMATRDLVSAAFGGTSSGLGGIFGSIFGGSRGAASTGSPITESIPNPNAWQFHDGGIAGFGGRPIVVNPSDWDNAPRFHEGNLKADEIRAVLRKGEPVFKSMDHARAVVGGGAARAHVTVGVEVDGEGTIKAYVKNISEETAQRTVTDFSQTPQFEASVLTANTRNTNGMRR